MNASLSTHNGSSVMVLLVLHLMNRVAFRQLDFDCSGVLIFNYFSFIFNLFFCSFFFFLRFLPMKFLFTTFRLRRVSSISLPWFFSPMLCINLHLFPLLKYN